MFKLTPIAVFISSKMKCELTPPHVTVGCG